MKQPVFNRVGSKLPMLKELQKYIPKDIEIFVEPFVGSGIVFLNLSDGSSKIIINDLDEGLMTSYKFLKNLEQSDFDKYKFLDKSRYKDVSNYLLTLNKIWTKLLAKGDNLTEQEYFIKQLLSKLTFGTKGVGKLYSENVNLYNRFKRRIPDMIEKLQNTVISNISYEKILDKYDNQNTFFYLDPPYENSKKMYRHSSFPLEELEKNVRKLKGRFLLSLNDSPAVRELFADYRIVSVKVRASSWSHSNIRDEVLIMNY